MDDRALASRTGRTSWASTGFSEKLDPILRSCWRPNSKPDDLQNECRPGGSRLDAKRHSKSGIVTVIRLTDDGEFVDRCEFTDALYEIRNVEQPLLVVWYIHGWKHSADETDSDRTNFDKLIKELVAMQPQGENCRHVVGVYIGWDGAVGPPSLLRNFTFWNRKRAADRISQSSVLTKILAATRYARQQANTDVAKDLSILIGHSFGARILYTATCQVLIDQAQQQHPGRQKHSYGVMRGPADLILLLNPALEASVFTAMDSIRRPLSKNWEGINKQQQPLLLAIASDNDFATGRLFPWGQRFALAFSERQRSTLGNHKDYVTHRLECHDKLAANNGFWYDNFEAGGLQLLRKATTQPGNPFMVAGTPSDVIDGHNGIWGPALRSWLGAFLLEVLSKRASASSTPRRLV